MSKKGPGISISRWQRVCTALGVDRKIVYDYDGDGSNTTVRCPLHDDQNPSLSVSVGYDGWPVIECHGACDTSDPRWIGKLYDWLEAHGLQAADRPPRAGGHSTGSVAPTAASGGRKPVRGRAVVRHYDYRDEDGRVLYRVTKRRYENGDKATSQKAWTGQEWRTGKGAMTGVRRVLYGLDDLLEFIEDGAEIHLCEGESDADALNDHFEQNDVPAFATCHSGGAGKWRDDYTDSLAGATSVVVWADRDQPGYRCALQRLEACEEAGLPVRAVLPLPTYKDAREHLDAGHEPANAVDVTTAELAQLSGTQADREGEVQRALLRLQANEEAKRRYRELTNPQVSLPRQTLAQLLDAPQREPTPHRVSGLHAVGYNTTITAQYKTGKTTLLGNLIRALVDDKPFLDRFEVLRPDGRVGLLNYELTDEDQVSWLEAMGIIHDEDVAPLNLRGSKFTFATEAGQAELVRWCRDQDVEVLVVDPHRRAFRGFGKENDNDDVNRFTAVLDEVKAEANVKDLFLSVHTGRGEAERARGATALDDWADQRWVLVRDNGLRYFRADDGRLASVDEFSLDYEYATRTLTAGTGTRSAERTSARREMTLSKLQNRILDALAHPETKRPIASRPLYTLVGGNLEDFGEQCRELVKAQKITMAKKGISWQIDLTPEQRETMGIGDG